MRKLPAILALSAVLAGGALVGCSGGDATDQPPVPTTAATDEQGNNANIAVPADLVGKNAQTADDELRKAGFVNIKYGSADTTVTVDPAHLADWKVTKTDPAGGATVPSNENIVVTVVKQ